MIEPSSSAIQRVLLVHDYAGTRGGAEVVIQDMRDALRRRGVDARLMTSTADPSDRESAADYSFQGSTTAFRALREMYNPDAVRVARHVVQSFDPQIVHLGMILTQTSPAILPAFAGRHVVWVPNEFRPICPSGTRLLPSGRPCTDPAGYACWRNGCFSALGLPPRLLQLALLRHWQSLVDVVVSPSEAFAEQLRRHGIPVTTILPHGVPMPTSDEPPAPTPNLLGFAGRLVPEKGTHVLLHALALLPPSLGDVRLRIAGDGPDRDRLEDLARALGITDRVEFLGFVSRDDVQHHLASATVQVIPSLWNEPFGLVAIEAMARGTPVVASATGALRELIEDGRTGYLVPPDDPQALANRLAEVLVDPVGLASVRREARSFARGHFDIEDVTSRFLDLYTNLLRRPLQTP